jgi:hypothetical protein
LFDCFVVYRFDVIDVFIDRLRIWPVGKTLSSIRQFVNGDDSVKDTR